MTRTELDAQATHVVGLIRSRESDGIDQLLILHGREIHALAYSICRDYQAAEDVAAETIITSWQRIHTLRDPKSLRPWLLKIATRHALQQVRKSRHWGPGHQSTYEAATRDDIEGEVVSRMTVSEVLSALPPRTRAVLSLRYVMDLSIDEIAEVTEKSRNTVKTELRLGLRRLRTNLSGSSWSVHSDR